MKSFVLIAASAAAVFSANAALAKHSTHHIARHAGSGSSETRALNQQQLASANGVPTGSAQPMMAAPVQREPMAAPAPGEATAPATMPSTTTESGQPTDTPSTPVPPTR
jgi:hypothetical protein